MKKLISVFLVFLLLCGLVGSFAMADDGISGEITFFTWVKNDETGYPYTLAEAFEEKFPNTKVNIEIGSPNNVEEYLQMQKVKLLAGEEIDVTIVRPESRQDYVDAGYLVNLDGKQFLSNYSPAFLDLVKINGSVYSVPNALDTVGVLYNKDMFAEKGWTVPTNWDEFIGLLENVKAEGMALMNGGKDGWPMEMDVYVILHDLMAKDPSIFEKIDNGEIKYTDEIILNAFKKIDEFYKAGYVGQEALSLSFDQAAAYFSQQKTPMIIHGSWLMGNLDLASLPFELGVFPLPHNQAGEPQVASTAIGSSIAVTTCSKYPEVAMAFVDFMSSVEGGQYYTDGTGNFSPVTGVENEAGAIWIPLLEMDQATDFFYNVQYAGANSEMLAQLQLMLLGEVTPEEACANIQAVQDKK